MAFRRFRAATIAVTAAVAMSFMLVTPSAVAETRRSASEAGAPGVGDPYFRYQGNGGFDVRHYDIAFSYDPATRRMNATTTVTAVATQKLDRFDLDFRGPDISMLTVNGTTAGFQRDGQELIITPGSSLPSGRVFTVVVKYAGVPPVITDPDGSIEGWVPTDDGAFVVGEPQGAPAWFPGNDHPTNKATFTFHATVPEGTTAVGNGRLLSQTTASGWTTFVWDSTEPMATYLATVTIGKFEITESTTPSGIPIYTAVDPRLVKRSAAAVAQIPDIIDYYRQTFGPYPFSSTGAIIDYAPNVGYALETQTRPVFCDVPSNAVGTMAHELAHQWFGDSVSVRHWSDIWLNEGFATYSEWLWSEHTGGMTAQKLFEQAYAGGKQSFWKITIADPGVVDMFSDPVYDRGAMTLHALRGKVGDAAFFQILRQWVQAYRYGNATTTDFIKLSEKESGMDLTSFFGVWLYQKGKPTTW
ncbi:M1 family metallopeptidase [Streptomyces sp. NPDC014889]|uniref:M1 family metallopeptidase n=1 Tax=Streptomyces sp. NPDC014889 TaxID=3364928 RepID=UPI0036F8887D